MGRMGRRDSLRAMNIAWDQGITLFDTARSYGFGEAEAVLGEFLHGKRVQATVATKFGIIPQKLSKMERATRNVPRLRKFFAQDTNYEVPLPEFTVEGLRASLECSLRQLKTDYVDVLFLHEATADVLRQHDLMEALDTSVVAEGMGSGLVTLSAMQFDANPFDPVVSAIPRHNRRGMLLIGNHPFGDEQRVTLVQSTLEAISSDKTTPAELRDKLRYADWETITEAIFGVILNSSGIHALVLSMMQEDHLLANVRAVESDRFTIEDLALIRERLLCAQEDASGA
jgi:diketogulonate reductase-like aldo/keto reductase